MNLAETLSKPSFRLLLVPFGGPIKRPGGPPEGLDFDLERFSENTDIGRSLYASLPMFWSHGDDPALGGTRLGTFTFDAKASRDGWWGTAVWKPREPAVELIRALAHRTPIFGSSQPLGRSVRRNRQTAEITQWHVCEATLSTAVQNTYARIAPVTQ